MSTKTRYIPVQGDIVWINFQPQAGREQSGIRPAIVLTPLSYNSKVGLAIFCPITSKVKGYPFEVKLNENLPVEGVVLSDQAKSMDWRSRNCNFICHCSNELVEEVIAKLNTLIQ